MAAVDVVAEERQARAKHRQQQRMRRGRERALAKARRENTRAEARYHAWLEREKRAYAEHVREPENERLLVAWRDCWRSPDLAFLDRRAA